MQITKAVRKVDIRPHHPVGSVAEIPGLEPSLIFIKVADAFIDDGTGQFSYCVRSNSDREVILLNVFTGSVDPN